MRSKNIFYDKYTLIVFALSLIFLVFNTKQLAIPLIQAESSIWSIIISILIAYILSVIIAFLYRIAKAKKYF